MAVIGLLEGLKVQFVEGSHVALVGQAHFVEFDGTIKSQAAGAFGATFVFEGGEDLVLGALKVFFQLSLRNDAVTGAGQHRGQHQYFLVHGVDVGQGASVGLQKGCLDEFAALAEDEAQCFVLGMGEGRSVQLHFKKVSNADHS